MAQSSPLPRNGATETSTSNGSNEVTLEALLTEGDALRDLLQQMQTRLSRLLSGLKQHRRQAKAVESALATLRPFQRSGGG